MFSGIGLGARCAYYLYVASYGGDGTAGGSVYAKGAGVTAGPVTKVLETVRKYLNGWEMTEELGFKQRRKAGARDGGILGLPITYLIDRQGRIAARHVGATEAAVFEAEVKKLLTSAAIS